MNVRFPIDKTLNKIFDEVFEEFKDEGVDRQQITESFYLLWANTKEILKSNKYPKVIFPKWGTYEPSVYNLKKLAKNLERGGKTEDHEHLVNVIDRLNNEKTKRKRNAN